MKRKVTKSKIKTELKTLKWQELRKLRTAHQQLREEFKLSLIKRKCGTQIQELVEIMQPIHEKVNKLEEFLRDDKDLSLGLYNSYSLLKCSTSEEDLLKYLMDYCSFDKGIYAVYKHDLAKKRDELEEEWDKLITYVTSLPLAKAKEYLVENNITLPCMQETDEEEETRLVVQDINFNKLWSNVTNE